jgi:hypothetical protein
MISAWADTGSRAGQNVMIATGAMLAQTTTDLETLERLVEPGCADQPRRRRAR